MPIKGHLFCPKCGKAVDRLEGKVCEDCAGKNVINAKLLTAPASIKVDLCRCGAARSKGRWERFERLDSLVDSVVKSKLKRKTGVSVIVDFDEVELKGKTHIPVTVRAVRGDERDVKNIDFIIHPMACPECSRKFGNYFEATLQVRSKNTAKIIDRVEEIVKETEENFDNAFITKIEKVKGGFDVSLGSKKQATHIVSDLKRLFDLQVVRSNSVVGQKKDKVITRATFSLKDK